MSADQITAIAAAVLSIAFSYVSGLRSRYEPLSDEAKRLIMLGLLALVTVGVFALACSRFGVFLGIGDGEHRSVACDEPGLVGLAWTLVLAVMANQSNLNVIGTGYGEVEPSVWSRNLADNSEL